MIQKYILTFLMILICLLPATADRKCLGVADPDGNPVQGAAVVITDSLGNAIAGPAVTDSEGRACVEGDFSGTDLLECRRKGYVPYACRADESPHTVTLTPEATELEQLVVLAEKDVVRQKAGAMEFTPGSLRTEVRSIYDLIGYVPMVDNTGGSFSIIGKPGGAAIWINGRQPHQDMASLLNELRTYPASMIKKVEVITNPGGVMGATSSAGIINIILDNPYVGVTGMLNASLSYDNRLSHSESAWMTYAGTRWRTTVNAAYADRRSYTTTFSEYEYSELGKEFSASSATTSRNQGFKASGTVAYTVSRNTVIGAGFSIEDGWTRETETSVGTQVIDGVSSPVNDRIHRLNRWTRPDYSVSAWLDQNVLPGKSMLEVSAGYFSSTSPARNICEFGDETEIQLIDRPVSGFNARARYRHLPAEGHLITAGGDFNHYSMLYSDRRTGADEDRFRYRQTIGGVYVQWEAAWTPALSTMIGIRGELTGTRARQSQDGSDRREIYFEPAPFLSVGYQFGRGQQSLNLDVARRFSRPWYSELNPYKKWYTQNSYRTGNPGLRRPHRWEFGLNYNFLGCGVLSLDYAYATDDFWNYSYAQDGYTVSSLTNLDIRREMSLSAQFYKSFWKRWRVNVTASYDHAYSRGTIGDDLLQAYTDVFTLSLRSNLVLSYRYSWRMSMMYRLRSPDVSLTNRTGWHNTFNIGVNKEFPFGLEVALSGSNLFFRSRPLTYSSPEYSSYFRMTGQIWNVGMSLTYRFGKTTVLDVRSKDQGIEPKL